MINVILAVIICFLLGMAAAFILKEKKRGNTCIGCPHSCNCNHREKKCS